MTVFTRLLVAAAALSAVRLWAGIEHSADVGQVFVLPSPAAATASGVAPALGARAPLRAEAAQGSSFSLAASSAAVAVAALALGLGSRPAAKPARSGVVACKAEAAEVDVMIDEDDDEDEEYEEDDEDDYFDDDEDDDRLEAVCKARFLIGSPYKFRRVLFQIKGKTYREALMLLEFLPWRACKPVLKALQSAAANAQNHFNMDKSRLYISRCRAEKGPFSKRMRPVSKGQAHMYLKKTTHLYIWVAEMDDDELEDFA